MIEIIHRKFIQYRHVLLLAACFFSPEVCGMVHQRNFNLLTRISALKLIPARCYGAIDF